ncbi:hypothetical protein RWE15_19565 [Virgibacillus halophilus]|uniref:Uncharacterized protein n=1 Tax=Tigheibacillus halophilus TaxID=361280 RepID=A0ABU5CA82_9BACI|nr:hypothetical protein [Virgibacillus halophilus]
MKRSKKIQQYGDERMRDAITAQNKASTALSKAKKLKSGKEQTALMLQEALPQAKQALKDAKTFKAGQQPKELQLLQSKLIKPLETLKRATEAQVQAAQSEIKRDKQELQREADELTESYLEQLKNFHQELEKLNQQYDLQADWKTLELLKRQLLGGDPTGTADTAFHRTAETFDRIKPE